MKFFPLSSIKFTFRFAGNATRNKSLWILIDLIDRIGHAFLLMKERLVQVLVRPCDSKGKRKLSKAKTAKAPAQT